MTIMTTKANREIPLSRDLADSFRMYAMDVILDRALPDVRDGLKPVHRRILYAMHDMRITHNRPHKKSARVVGEVLGKYHPHGDQSVYDAMVRMAQDFSMRYPLVDGQGNFGSIDGDNAAAMRYTEARMSALADLLMQDIDMDTVRWQNNFDDSLQEPVVLPTVVPNLLVNGSSGIAVAMSTNIPPHNLNEISDAVIYLCRRWQERETVTVDDLMEFVQGPDFPTAGLAFRYRDEGGTKVDVIRQMYESGEGKITMQAEVSIEKQGGGKDLVVITALPYMVQKSTVMSRIGSEVRKGRIEGIGALRDESDHEGMRVVVETMRGHDAASVLDQLLQYTQLRETFGAQMLALFPTEDGMKPRYFSLRDALTYFINHRLTVIERRSRFERTKLQDRLHIVEGLLIALDAIDEVIATIKKSRSRDTARVNLERQFKLSEKQAAAIVALPLGNLANLEVKKLRDEAKELKARIKQLTRLIESESARLDVVVTETEGAKAQFTSPRRTRIIESAEHVGQALMASDLTEPQIVSIYADSAERRDCAGYRDTAMLGLTGRRTSTPLGRWYADPADRVIVVAADGDCWHDQTVSVNDGIVTKGKNVVGGGIITEDARYIVTVTEQGQVKRTEIPDLHGSWGQWARLIGLLDGDKVIAAGVDTGNAEIMIFTRQGQAIRFKANDVNPQQSSSARGVGGIKVAADDRVIAARVFDPETAGHVVILSEKGWLKRVPVSEWPIQGRNGKGVQSLAITGTTGPVMAATVTRSDDNYIDFITEDGRRLRFKYEDLPEENRRNRGVEVPDLLKEKVDKKDKTKWADVGRVVSATALSATYAYRAK